MTSLKILSDTVEKNFSMAAFSYERAARVQRDAAMHFLDFIHNTLPGNFKPDAIMELGCGTGFITKRLVRTFEGSKILISDISDEMLEICRRKIYSSTGKSDAWQLEFEILDFNQDFDLIPNCKFVVSGLSFQWAEDLPDLINRIFEQLPDGGILAFSILLDGSLGEFRRIFESAGVDYPVPPHPRLCEIREYCKKFSDFRSNAYTLSSVHSSFRSFLLSLKNVGAVNPGINKLSPGKMKKIISSAPKGEFMAEYQIANIICEK